MPQRSNMAQQPLCESFDQPRLSPLLHWQSEPSRWLLNPDRNVLQIWPDAQSDFWQRTHYGFQADNGHLLYLSTSDAFQIDTCVKLYPQHQYDQAGLMIWISSDCWIKTSVEFELEGFNHLGAVVTNHGYSDWSTQPIDHSILQIWFRLTLKGNDVTAESSLDGQQWQQLRVAPLLGHQHGTPIRCGLYACSPKAAGFCVDFKHLRYTPLRTHSEPSAG
ncbi:MAG TPA: DUF1349 domain-containing protein [Planctomycetaceae bacterium]|nr:DUF1349 domain-containing protein [Planctomycetaceae bacterium]